MIFVEEFGVTKKGERVMLFRLSGVNAAVELISYGCAIRAVQIPGGDGELIDVCAGYESLAEYEAHVDSMGAVVGRTSGRVKNARFTLNGREYRLEKNAGENQLHGGFEGFGTRVWDWELRGDSVVFSRLSPDGEGGYPGNLAVEISYTLTDENELLLDYRAETDRDTLCAMTNHAYWHLGAPGIDGLALAVDASDYVEAGYDLLPTGRLLPLAGSGFDFRSPAPVGGTVIDHSFPVAGEGLRRVLRLSNPENGLGLTMLSTLPTIHVYTGDGLPEPRSSVALEAQFIPNGINSEVFPSPILRKGDVWKHRTVYKFG